MVDRLRFPNLRAGASFDFSHGGVDYHAIVNWFENASIGEIFLDAGKTGSAADIIADEAAVVFSLARQHGTPLDVLRDALPKLPDGSPAGPLGLALEIAERRK
jgi:hypothetical protein